MSGECLQDHWSSGLGNVMTVVRIVIQKDKLSIFMSEILFYKWGALVLQHKTHFVTIKN